MKKTIVAAVAGMMLMASGTAVFAASGNVKNTLHNLAAGSGPALRAYYANTETQICVFCHTPHNAGAQRPLWNRNQPSHAFNTYTAANLTNTARAVTAPGGESLMCLSCHDGVSALNVVHNMPSGTGTATGSATISTTAANLAISSTSLGSNLTNDHPISFSYTAAQAETPTKLVPIGTAKLNGVRFFGPKGDMLECTSCHDPHVVYGTDRKGNSIGGNINLRPFLAVRNDGSFLCLSCHNK